MSGELQSYSPGRPEYAFVRAMRDEGAAWSEIATTLGLSRQGAKKRYDGRAANGHTDHVWAEHSAEAMALIKLLMDEPSPAAVLAVYLVQIQRKLASMSPELARQAALAGRALAEGDVGHGRAPPEGPQLRGWAGLEAVAEEVARAHGISPALISGPERTAEVCLARDHFAWEAKSRGFTLIQAGKFAGGRDHSSMSQARKRHMARRGLA